MKTERIGGGAAALAAIAALILIGGPALAGEHAAHASKAGGGLEQFKKLAGTWEGTTTKGEKASVRFEVVAGGTAVMEQLNLAGHEDMVTVYHLDGDSLMLTHYCATGTQPRMKAATASGKEIRFEYFDGTGIPTAETGHMHRAVFNFEGNDRLKAAWTWREGGQDAFTVELNLKRTATATAAKGN